MKRILIAFLLGFLCAGTGYAACSGSSPSWTAADASNTEIQACIDGAGVQAGDTINVPAGTVTWTGAVTLSKNVHLKGAGIDSTVVSGNNVAITAVASGGNYPKVSGFTFVCSGSSSQRIAVNSATTQFAIVGNKFTATTSGDRCITVGDRTSVRPSGVIANNTFTSSDGPMSAILAQGDNTNYSRTLGASDGIYVEGNTMTASTSADGVGWIDSDYAQSIIFRYNSVTNGGEMGTHGAGDLDPSTREGVMTWEWYNNLIAKTEGTPFWGIHLRGGTGVAFKNSFTTSGGGVNLGRPIGLQDYRSTVPDGAGCDDATNSCDGDHTWDGNTVALSGTSAAGGSTTVMNTTGLTASAWVGYRLFKTSSGNSCKISANTTTTVTCSAAMEGSDTWDGEFGYEIRSGWPCYYQVGTAAGTTYGTTGRKFDSVPAYFWDNICSGSFSYGCSGGVQSPSVAGPDSSCRVTTSMITLGRDYFNSEKSGYSPYTCPHPLAGTGSCDSTKYGTDGYSLTGETPAATGTHRGVSVGGGVWR